MNSTYAPLQGEKINKGRYSEIRRFSKIYIGGFAILSIGLMIISLKILHILGGEGYADAKYVMAPVALGCVYQFKYTMFVNVEQLKKKTIGMAFASTIADLVNLILNDIFIPKVGYLEAAHTTLAGYLVLLEMHMFLVQKLNPVDVYAYKMVIIILLTMCLITVLISILYSFDTIRCIFLGFYCMFCMCIPIKNKDKLFMYLKRRM